MESLERKMDLLRTIGPFAEVATAPLRPVADAASVTRFGAGEVIVRQGDPGDAVYALIEGKAEVWLEDSPQRPVLLRTMRSGQLFGETAVLYRGPRSATIRAETDVTTLRIPASVFLDLLQSSPELAVRIAVILAQRLASDRHTLASDPTISGAA
ncbi:MAG TPA: cyclic nucleotide-binding domain-containing protein [Methylomirabilota bacterium]|jgi:CRP-like cAMP-binding protein|nr:cyclic nucleotide-binding domain-containing protein [Methylomirabilota bacterium]